MRDRPGRIPEAVRRYGLLAARRRGQASVRCEVPEDGNGCRGPEKGQSGTASPFLQRDGKQDGEQTGSGAAGSSCGSISERRRTAGGRTAGRLCRGQDRRDPGRRRADQKRAGEKPVPERPEGIAVPHREKPENARTLSRAFFAIYENRFFLFSVSFSCRKRFSGVREVRFCRGG